MTHSCMSLFLRVAGQRSCRTLLRDTVVGYSCGTLQFRFRTKSSSKIHAPILQNERFVRDVLKNSRVSLQNVRFVRDFSKFRAVSILQDERFARDILKNSRFESAKRASSKRAFRARHPPKVTCQSLQNAHFARDILCKSSGTPIRAHTSSSPAKQFRDYSLPQQRHSLPPRKVRREMSPLLHLVNI